MEMEARGPKRSPEVVWATLRPCLKTKKHNYILKSSHPSQGTTFCQAWWYTQKTSKDIRGSKPVWASKTLSLFLVYARACTEAKDQLWMSFLRGDLAF